MENASKNGIGRATSLMVLLKRHRQLLVDVYIFINVAIWICWQTWKTWAAGTMGYVEVAFAAQNLVLLALFLLRRQHRGLDRRLFHQVVAATAFYSGIAFMGQPSTGGAFALEMSNVVTFLAHILGIVTLVNLGQSFGVLIAIREIKTRGIYSIVRHPMYLSDILFRVGFIISHFNLLTCVLFILSSACYVYRAVLEEKFLVQDPIYRDYMNRVKYRFIPYVL